jgi:AGZA family xanthine/uracil permease-like MFS transporter
MLVYFGRVRFRGGIPGGLVAVALGTILAWLSGVAPVGELPQGGAALFLPVPVLGDLISAFSGGRWLTYVSVIVPMGLFNVLGSLQNIESAEAAGDSYETTPALAVNGIGTIAAACFGSCFPTTIYIGHPGWKALGARAGYSVLNAAFFTVILVSGTLAYIVWAVPIDAGMAIVLWIGMVITAQAFQATPREHAPAVVMGLLPGVAAWGALVAKNGLRAAGYGVPGGPVFSEDLIPAFLQSDTWIHGAFALEQGFILVAMLISAATVAIIGRRFVSAAIWCGAAALLAGLGLIHSYRWTLSDTAVSLSPAWPWAAGYAIMAACLVAARWVTEPIEARREK